MSALRHWKTFGADPADPFAVIERCLAVTFVCLVVIGVCIVVTIVLMVLS